FVVNDDMIDYVLHKYGSNWQVHDVIADDILDDLLKRDCEKQKRMKCKCIKVIIFESDTIYDYLLAQTTYDEGSDYNHFQSTSAESSDHNLFQVTSDESSKDTLKSSSKDTCSSDCTLEQKKVLKVNQSLDLSKRKKAFYGKQGSSSTKAKKSTILSEIVQWYDDLCLDDQRTIYKGRRGSSFRNEAITKPEKPKSGSKHLAPTTRTWLTCTTLVVPTKRPPPVTNCVVGLAAVTTWQRIQNKEFGIISLKEAVGGSLNVRSKATASPSSHEKEAIFEVNVNQIRNIDPPAGLFVNHITSSFHCVFVSLDTRIKSRIYTSDKSFTLGYTDAVDNVSILQSCNGKLIESLGCLVLVHRDFIDSSEFTIYEMRKGCSVWSIKHAFDYVYNSSTNLFKILPEPDYANDDSNFYGCAGLRLTFDPTKSSYYKVMRAGHTCSDIVIQIYCSEKGNWSLCNERFNYFFLHFDGAMENDSFLMINLSEKVVEYNLISKNLRDMYDMGSNQVTDDYHDGFISPFAMYDMRAKQVDHKVFVDCPKPLPDNMMTNKVILPGEIFPPPRNRNNVIQREGEKKYASRTNRAIGKRQNKGTMIVTMLTKQSGTNDATQNNSEKTIVLFNKRRRGKYNDGDNCRYP
nr:hypothetical protein [Tanacetum cinerariifolium]